MKNKSSMMSTDKILDKYRRKMKYTQENLSEITGISRVQLARILTGTSHPSKDSLEKLYKALNVGMEDIVRIDFYESFSKTPEDFQDLYIKLENRCEYLEKQVEHYKQYEDLERILESHFFKKMSK